MSDGPEFLPMGPTAATMLELAAENKRLYRSRERMRDLLERAAEVLNGYADVRDGDNGPRPNAAMSMESEITEFLREASRV